MTGPGDHEARATIRLRHDRTLFVEAGAGTGKTTALVARVVHMVATGHLTQMSELVAITFTENAAAELRNRLRQALQPDTQGMFAGHPYPDDMQRRALAQALADLDDAVLTTLHGFAARILSEAPLEARLPPGFSVHGGRGGDEESQQSWGDFVDELLEDEGLRRHLLCGLTLGLKVDDLRVVAGVLGASWDRLRTTPRAVPPVPPVDATVVIGHLRTALADEDRWPEDGLSDHLRRNVVPLVQELNALDHELDLLEALERADITCGAGKAPDWKAAGLDKSTVVDALRDAHAARNRIVSEVGAAVTEALSARVQQWLLDESERRRDRGALEYHDLLVLARDVLRADADVRARLHQRWPVLLIDEFQDTDPLQVEIAVLLAGDCEPVETRQWSEIPVAPGRLFFVGDPKQSIYRFRRAEISLFTAVGARHESAHLSVNFRSVPGVLRAANAAFSALIGQDPQAGIPYADLGESRAAVSDEPPVLLLGGPRPGSSAAELRQQEAAHLADVAVRAKDGWTVGDGRLASYKDMAVLLPTRTSLPSLERALQARGVPYRIESRSLVWSTDAVRTLVALLQAVAEPADEVALLAALRSPGLACSDEDLVVWRAAGGRWSIFAQTPQGTTADHPVASALAVLRSWHDQRWWLPVNQLVDLVVRELRLVELTASQRRPRDHWRRLRFVVDQARAWCDEGGSGLGRFVAWAVQQVEDEDADVLETVVPEADDDAVRILTVHGSKGLEFPITMLAGLGGGAGRQPKVLWTGTGPQVRLKADVLETSGWTDAAGEEKEQDRREAVRLLYVAVTRAMDHLVLGCYHAPPKGRDAKRSAAQQLWEVLSVGPLASTEPAPTGADVRPAAESGRALLLPDRVRLTAERQELLDAVHRRVATSPTALTVLAGEPVERIGAEERAQRRGSSKGAAIGTATHRVLELVDVRRPEPVDVARLARLACAEQGIPALAADVESRVWSALRSDALQSALAHDGRALSEVYLVVRDGDRFLEGYVDLLVDTGPDGLTVLDYKTDRATTPDEEMAKRHHYAPQLAAYARAVEQVTGRAPTATDLVFARPGGQPPE